MTGVVEGVEPAAGGPAAGAPAAGSPGTASPAVEAGPAAAVTYRRSGLARALLSGVFWGADGVILGVALAMTPFVGAAALVAPLAVAALTVGDRRRACCTLGAPRPTLTGRGRRPRRRGPG